LITERFVIRTEFFCKALDQAAAIGAEHLRAASPKIRTLNSGEATTIRVVR
jgi:hypothetical protein